MTFPVPAEAAPPDSLVAFASDGLGLVSPADRPWYLLSEEPDDAFVGVCVPVWCPCKRAPVQLFWFRMIETVTGGVTGGVTVAGHLWLGQCPTCQRMIWAWRGLG